MTVEQILTEIYRSGCADEVFLALSKRGLIVLNPATLPQGMPNDNYMPICLQMLNAADVLILLNDWDKSVGTNIECKFAQYQDKPIYPLDMFINIYDGRADESEA